MERVVVHVWSELSSPRSYLGLLNLEEAVLGRNVAVEHHAFIPASPDHDVADSIEELTARGIAFTSGYTHDSRAAQELVYAGKAQGATPEEAAASGMIMTRLINEAALIHGRNIASHDVLADLGREAGLNPDEVRAGLMHGRWAAPVDGDLSDARRLRLQRAPYAIVAGMFSIDGPSRPADIVTVLEAAGGELVELKKAAVDEARDILTWRRENKEEPEH